MKRVAIALMLMCAAAAPTSQPAVSSDVYPALQKKLREVLAENATLKQQIALLQSQLATANEMIKKATTNVHEGRPTTQATNITPFGVGWEGQIGKARVIRRLSEKGAILQIYGKGDVWISGIDASNWADGMEVDSPVRIKIDRIFQESPGISTSYLFARPVS